MSNIIIDEILNKAPQIKDQRIKYVICPHGSMTPDPEIGEYISNDLPENLIKVPYSVLGETIGMVSSKIIEIRGDFTLNIFK